ncbi:hypothetical protein Q4566_15140, partial [Tamlana sp. 2_MG-2023]|nr:hypothetical protein [Tamlana sp. 2_MG-2023]MDO6792324.1 hypothetical protein [Tamlana sp. 1_MG-2023]
RLQEEQAALALAEEERLRKAEEARLAEEARVKAEQEAAALAEAERLRIAEEERLAEERRLQEEQAALALAEEERLRKAEEARLEEAAALAEAERLRIVEEERLAEERRLQEEQAALALAEEERLRKAEEARLAEEARVKAEQEAAALAEAERLRIEKEANLISEAERLKVEEAAALAEAAKLKAQKEEDLRAIVPTDEATKMMNDVARSAFESSKEQQELIDQLKEKVAIKQQDLDDLIEENNLSEQGIVKAPKAFKSISAENRELENLTMQIDNIVAAQNNKIRRLDRIYKERLSDVPDVNDATNKFYKRKIEELKAQQVEVFKIREGSIFKIEELKEEIKEERKRRIKRALYDNDQERYQKDRAALNVIRQNTPLSSEPITADDFDYGEELSNIQIVKGVKNIDEGYYMVVAVHSDIDKRDEFLSKAVAAGQKDINFFFDVNTSKYYIYYENYDSMNDAQNALNKKGNKSFNGKMSIVKIEK